MKKLELINTQPTIEKIEEILDNSIINPFTLEGTRKRINNRLGNNFINVSDRMTEIKKKEKERIQKEAEESAILNEKKRLQYEEEKRLAELEIKRLEEEEKLLKEKEKKEKQDNLNISKLIPKRIISNALKYSVKDTDNLINKADITNIIKKKKEEILKSKEEIKIQEDLKLKQIEQQKLEIKQKEEEEMRRKQFLIDNEIKFKQNLVKKKAIYINFFKK